jgi:hypothetical protein
MPRVQTEETRRSQKAKVCPWGEDSPEGVSLGVHAAQIEALGHRLLFEKVVGKRWPCSCGAVHILD